MQFIGIIKATYDELKNDGFKQSVDFVLDEYIRATGKFKDTTCKVTSMVKGDKIVLFRNYLIGDYCEFACYADSNACSYEYGKISNYIAEKRLQEGR